MLLQATHRKVNTKCGTKFKSWISDNPAAFQEPAQIITSVPEMLRYHILPTSEIANSLIAWNFLKNFQMTVFHLKPAFIVYFQNIFSSPCHFIALKSCNSFLLNPDPETAKAHLPCFLSTSVDVTSNVKSTSYLFQLFAFSFVHTKTLFFVTSFLTKTAPPSTDRNSNVQCSVVING